MCFCSSASHEVCVYAAGVCFSVTATKNQAFQRTVQADLDALKLVTKACFFWVFFSE